MMPWLLTQVNKNKFAAAETKFSGKTGTYDITLTTMTETDGESTYKVLMDGKLVRQFTNPKTSVDYKPTTKMWNNISVSKGATIRVEFNTATNSNKTSGRIPYARGRWIALTLVPPGAKKAKAGNSTTRIFEETGGIVAVEVEHFAVQTETETRKRYITSASHTPEITPGGDRKASSESKPSFAANLTKSTWTSNSPTCIRLSFRCEKTA